ncbi:MAG: hypothetical protein ACRDQ0_13005, partial [Pseudonocardia sp.]
MVKGERVSTTTGRLARLGFEDADASERALDRLGDAGEQLQGALAATADPDQAVDSLADLADVVEDRAEFLRSLTEDEELAHRLLSVLGASSALGDHLLRHPEH